MWLIIIDMFGGFIFLDFFLKISTVLLGDLRGNYVPLYKINETLGDGSACRADSGEKGRKSPMKAPILVV